jgi:hypothetical protein
VTGNRLNLYSVTLNLYLDSVNHHAMNTLITTAIYFRHFDQPALGCMPCRRCKMTSPSHCGLRQPLTVSISRCPARVGAWFSPAALRSSRGGGFDPGGRGPSCRSGRVGHRLGHVVDGLHRYHNRARSRIGSIRRATASRCCYAVAGQRRRQRRRCCYR